MWSADMAAMMLACVEVGVGLSAAAAALRSRDVVPSALVPVLRAEQTIAMRWLPVLGLRETVSPLLSAVPDQTAFMLLT